MALILSSGRSSASFLGFLPQQPRHAMREDRGSRPAAHTLPDALVVLQPMSGREERTCARDMAVRWGP